MSHKGGESGWGGVACQDDCVYCPCLAKEGRGEVVCQDDCVYCPYPTKEGRWCVRMIVYTVHTPQRRGGGMSG